MHRSPPSCHEAPGRHVLHVLCVYTLTCKHVLEPAAAQPALAAAIAAGPCAAGAAPAAAGAAASAAGLATALLLPQDLLEVCAVNWRCCNVEGLLKVCHGLIRDLGHKPYRTVVDTIILCQSST